MLALILSFDPVSGIPEDSSVSFRISPAVLFWQCLSQTGDIVWLQL